MNITGFDKVAPYLTNPLVLVGFVLMLAYGIHWQLMKSGLLTQATKKDSALIIRIFLRYGFWLALVLVLAGFGLQFSGIGLSAWNSYMDKEKVVAVNAGKVAEQLYAQLDTKDQQLSTKDEQIKALTEAVTALSKTGAPAKSINDALRALEQGDTKQAQAIFAEVLRSKVAEGQQANKEAAAAARHLGALAYMNDTKAAFAAYRTAVELDPDNTQGLNMLGLLLQCTGELDKAEEMHKKALEINNNSGCKEGTACANINLGIVYQRRGELGKAEQLYREALKDSKNAGDTEGVARAYGNLGLVYADRGNMDQAKEMHRKALAINEALGRKDGMAKQYAALGLVYQKRGDLDKAEQMYRKALVINEALGDKEGIAHDYWYMGFECQMRGEFAQAEAAWKKSLRLFQAMGHPNAKKVQHLLDDLARQRSTSSTQ
ncbi:Tfp pilus assembly protein PilF [Candidatus Electrothrix aarhusensis]|uniref:Tfp pilus assembly protein PilF n=1 Tax=Candidatus Electrothrix aarhusensis TaxID=1859131 RepID=A0A444IYW7_9BACT|nr:Tfp pilus assembly protein PilF [Candidatus Electrothrix aarhusensis]